MLTAKKSPIMLIGKPLKTCEIITKDIPNNNILLPDQPYNLAMLIPRKKIAVTCKKPL